MAKKVIYFLCTGNSARSQIAEGLGKKYLSDVYEVHSAGIEINPVHPYAIQVMDDIGIDITQQTSDLINLDLFRKADIVVTLCKDAYERCPNVPPRTKHIHWGFDDPAAVQGTEEEKIAIFVKTRDGLEKQIKQFAEDGLDGTSMFIDKEQPFFPLKDNFGEVLQEIRKEQGLNQDAFAEALNMNPDFIKRAEDNNAIPSKFFVYHLASLIKQDYNTVLNRLYDVEG